MMVHTLIQEHTMSQLLFPPTSMVMVRGFGAFGCYFLILEDSYGDGWNGVHLRL